MQKYTIQWSSACLSDLSNERYTHLFLFERQGRIIFIGNPAGRDFQSFIPDVAEVLTGGGEVKLWLGRFVRTSNKPIEAEVMEAARRMLCTTERPLMNGRENYNFTADFDLGIANTGLSLLPGLIRYESGRMYRSQSRPVNRSLRLPAA